MSNIQVLTLDQLNQVTGGTLVGGALATSFVAPAAAASLAASLPSVSPVACCCCCHHINAMPNVNVKI
jgi:cytochrome c553